MFINKVTFTGADSYTRINSLLALSIEHPYIEWGILCSKTKQGHPRYPDENWLDDMYAFWQGDSARKNEYYSPSLHLSCHVCGRWVGNLLDGGKEFYHDMGVYLPMFERIQINTGGKPLYVKPEEFIVSLNHFFKKKQIICQDDGFVGRSLYETLNLAGVNCVPLFDLSGGEGKTPAEWPKRLTRPTCFGGSVPAYCGYAGGLGPDNLAEELKRIEAVVGSDDVPIWIDMESNLRSESGVFDLDRVKKCLEIVQPWISKNA
jgi:hypothetical protein